MCGGGSLIDTLAEVGLPIAGAFLGPEVFGAGSLAGALGGALGGAGGSLIGGTNPLIGAVEGGAGGFLGNGGLDQIANATGLSDLVSSSGLSSLFGGTPQDSSSLSSDLSGIQSAAPASAATDATATAPVNFAPGGYNTGSITAAAGSPGGSAIGGGTLAGTDIPTGADSALPSISGGNVGTAAIDPSALGGVPSLNIPNPVAAPSTNALPWQTSSGSLDSNISAINPGTINPAGIGASPQAPSLSNTISNLFSPSNTGTANFDINGNPAGASSFSAPQQLAGATGAAISPTGGTMSSMVGGGNSMINGLVQSGLGALLNNPNNKGYNAQISAGNNINSMFQPFVQTGTTANTTLSNLLGENGATPAAQAAAQANFASTPGYQFALNQGENAVNANAAATGQTLSGNNQQAIQNYGTGLADQTYNNYVSNLQNQINTGVGAAGGAATGIAGTANAQAGKGQAGANIGNTALGTGLNALFPTGGINLQTLLSGGTTGNNANNGILSYLFG